MSKSTISVLRKDGYKVGHPDQYPDDTTLVYSNFTPRAMHPNAPVQYDKYGFFGAQLFVLKYLVDDFKVNFFDLPEDFVVNRYQRRMDGYLGKDSVSTHRIRALHKLGYLPLHIKALKEGSFVPHGIPCVTVRNTLSEFFWLTNMIETLMSCEIWGPITSLTSAFYFRNAFDYYAKITVSDEGSPLTPWQGHDFSFRGMFGSDAAESSAAAHLCCFLGTDTLPALDLLEDYYGGLSSPCLGGSVAATEHSVMCAGKMDSEKETIHRLLTKVYPTGIVSIVSDTWDFWNTLTNIYPSLKDVIMLRDGKMVVRPDSGDPVKVICGDLDADEGSPQRKGAIQLLWDTFGGTLTEKGFKQLDSHVGLIYGDSITPRRCNEILYRLWNRDFASTNVVLGIGSYNYQYVTRDTHGNAFKATYVETASEGGYAIFKAPKEDSFKKSARGLLAVHQDQDGEFYLKQDCTWAEERQGFLQTIFLDGKAFNLQTIEEIRAKVREYL